MIKILKIKNEKEYNKLLQNYLILSAESLKYISQTRNFRKIIKLAREVEQTSLYKFHKVSHKKPFLRYKESEKSNTKEEVIMRVEILLRELRQNKGLTLDELAKLTRMSKGHLSRIERQETEPTISTLVRLAFALHVKVEELYKIINQFISKIFFSISYNKIVFSQDGFS